jgi:predicted transcriptional regulator
LAREV